MLENMSLKKRFNVLFPEEPETKRERNVWKIIEDVRQQVQNNESTALCDFITETRHQMNENTTLHYSMLASLCSGSFWVDLYHRCISIQTPESDRILWLDIFCQLIRFKSHLLLGIELLGVRRFCYLLRDQIVLLIEAFTTQSDIQYKIYLLQQSLQMPTNMARSVISRDMDSQGESSFQELHDVCFMDALEVLFSFLVSQKEAVKEIFVQNTELLNYYSELINVIICITANDSMMLFKNVKLLKFLFISIGEVSLLLATHQDNTTDHLDETKTLRVLRKRELEELKELNTSLQLSSLYSSATCHLFNHVKDSSLLFAGQNMRFFFSFLKEFDHIIFQLFPKNQDFILALLEGLLQMLIRVRVLEYWDKSDKPSKKTSHFFAALTLSTAFKVEKLFRHFASKSKLAKEVVMWSEKWKLRSINQDENTVVKLRTQTLHLIAMMNYVEGSLNVCFNPSCPCPIREDKNNTPSVQTTRDNTMLRFLDENPLKLNTEGMKTIPILQKCSGCHLMQYCCKDCQRQDWVRHKPDCQATRKARETEQFTNEENTEWFTK